VVDLSDPGWAEQLNTVHAILDELGSDTPRRLIGNQIDRCPAEAVAQARALDPLALFISATAGLGLENLRHWLFSDIHPDD
jgi:GTP-binding protein HflX